MFTSILRFGIGAILLPASLLLPQAASADDYGNTPATAYSTVVNHQLSGSIETAGDQDWFKVTVTDSRPNAAFEFRVYTMGGTDTWGALYDSNLNLLAWNDDGNRSSTYSPFNFWLTASGQYLSLKPGTYYLQVRHYSGSGTGSYKLFFDAYGAGADDRSNGSAEATEGGCGNTIGAPTVWSATQAINYPWDGDFTCIRISTRMRLTASSTATSLDMVGYLRDADGDIIQWSDDMNYYSNDFLLSTYLDPGTYFVHSRVYGYTNMGTYTINYRLE